MTKKQLQEQIDELKEQIEGIHIYTRRDVEKGISDTRLLKIGEYLGCEIKGGDILEKNKVVVDTFKLRKQFLALLDYLKIEYVVEDKHLEGFKKIK